MTSGTDYTGRTDETGTSKVLNRVEPGMIDKKGGGGTVLVVKTGEAMSGINVMRSGCKAAWRINVDRKGDV